MNKKIKNIIAFTTLATTGIYFINKIVNYTATMNHLLDDSNGNYYAWKNGKIYYTVNGTGTPILLIHNLHPSSSAAEWSKIQKKLEKKYKVYTIDLLGCGRSEKPAITYTNYLYVQLINDFVRDIIKEKATLIATGNSASFTIMSDIMNPENFNKVIVINPDDLMNIQMQPTQKELIYKHILDCPIFGTFLYNIEMHKRNIHKLFRERYYFNRSVVPSNIEDLYYESSHIRNGKGKHLLSSIRSNYTNVNTGHAIPKIKNLCIITSKEGYENAKFIDDYTRFNDEIEVTSISNSKYLPQLETPEKLFDALNMFLEK